ncbi:MAG: hypothetical protein ACSLFQ_11960 [Thermoanaerobaculia bacterium]
MAGRLAGHGGSVIDGTTALSVALQALAAAVACAGVFALWRSVDASVRPIATLGLLLRLVAGGAAFWISWLGLPVAPSLQLGGGFWFYGLDGIRYFKLADAAIANGVVVPIDATLPSFQYVQALAIGRWLFGASIATALLLNVASYLVACAIVSRWNRNGEAADRATRLAMWALALLPTWLLWSTQPLKDALFLALVVVFADVARRWVVAWRGGGALSALAIAALEMSVALYLLGGIRWYFGYILWYASLPAFAVAALALKRRRVAALAGAVVVFVLLAQPLVLTMWMGYGESVGLMFRVMLWLENSRESFGALEAATRIVPGPLIAGLPGADLIARTVACVVPRFIAMPAGLVEIGGGRGLWAIAELDTIAFVAFAISAIALAWKRGAGALRDPLVLLLLLSVLGAMSMLYVVNNFGTLLRLREMVLLPLLLMAVAASPTSRDHGTD